MELSCPKSQLPSILGCCSSNNRVKRTHMLNLQIIITSPSRAPSHASAVSWKCNRRSKRVYIFFSRSEHGIRQYREIGKSTPLKSFFVTFEIHERKMEREKYLGWITEEIWVQKGCIHGSVWIITVALLVNLLPCTTDLINISCKV